MATKSLFLASQELEIIQELSDLESTLVGGGHDTHATHVTIGCPGNGIPVHKHYPDGSWGSTCVYDDPIVQPSLSVAVATTSTNNIS